MKVVFDVNFPHCEVCFWWVGGVLVCYFNVFRIFSTDFVCCCIPGGMMPEFGVWKVEREAWRVALNEYLVKN